MVSSPQTTKILLPNKALDDLCSSDFDPMIQQVSKELLKQHLKIQKTSKYREMIQQRSKLPAYTMRKRHCRHHFEQSSCSHFW